MSQPYIVLLDYFLRYMGDHPLSLHVIRQARTISLREFRTCLKLTVSQISWGQSLSVCYTSQLKSRRNCVIELLRVLFSCTGSQEPLQRTKQYTTANQWLLKKEGTMVIPLWTGTPGQNLKPGLRLARPCVHLRWLAMTCAHFGRNQICTQVKASLSPFGHPAQVNASWMASIYFLLANEIEYVLARKLASPFGHPTQVSTQVQLASTCDYLPVRLTRALLRLAHKFAGVPRSTTWSRANPKFMSLFP